MGRGTPAGGGATPDLGTPAVGPGELPPAAATARTAAALQMLQQLRFHTRAALEDDPADHAGHAKAALEWVLGRGLQGEGTSAQVALCALTPTTPTHTPTSNTNSATTVALQGTGGNGHGDAAERRAEHGAAGSGPGRQHAGAAGSHDSGHALAPAGGSSEFPLSLSFSSSAAGLGTSPQSKHLFNIHYNQVAARAAELEAALLAADVERRALAGFVSTTASADAGRLLCDPLPCGLQVESLPTEDATDPTFLVCLVHEHTLSMCLTTINKY